TCKDVFKSCAFAGEPFACCTEDKIKTSLTEMGLCHSITLKLNQTTETENGGLQLILDSQKEEIVQTPIDSTRIFNYPLSDGFRIFLEEPDMHTYRSSHGISVAAGQSIFTGIQLTQYVLVDKCRDDWKGTKLIGHNTGLKYQGRDCRSKCLAKVFHRLCQCAPLVFDIDSGYFYHFLSLYSLFNLISEYKTCTPKESGGECDFCKVECNRYDYTSYNSFGGPLSNDAIKALTQLHSPRNEKKIRDNFIVVNLVYRDLSSLIYAAVGKQSLVSLLSNIGGSAGLCLGFSALTFIEIIVLAIKSVSYLFRKNDLDKKGVDYTENKKLEKSAIESLKEKHK
ncbi:hypothetical protein PENTCL1PPCAC_2575, partial [Pristionchus entomophagus]